MMSTSRVLGALLGLVAAVQSAPTPAKPHGTIVAVGSGACDGQDTHCKDHESAEKVMTLLTITNDGQLHKWTELSDLPGLAAWFAVNHAGTGNSKNCMFVTYPDSSSIGAFQLTASGVPTPSGTVPVAAPDANPVYADISSDGNTLVVANYHGPDNQNSSKGASVQTFAISEQCKLSPADLKPHAGSSINKDRQGAAHPHSAVVGRNNLVFVCDLGMDLIFTYNISSTGKLTELARTPTLAGSGPRHSMLHPTKDYLFVVSEMGSAVSSYHIEKSGKLTFIASTTTLPDTDPKGYGSKAPELAITPDGLHLYASNRAFAPMFKNTVAVFDISKDGKLTMTQQVDSPPFPRGMTLMPDGKFLLVASQTNGQVVSFKVNDSDGHLTPTNSSQRGPWGAAAFAILQEASRGYAAQVIV